jgi:hypothetical protein
VAHGPHFEKHCLNGGKKREKRKKKMKERKEQTEPSITATT